MNKILVTGGAGYIGSHTCVKLIENKYEPIIVDNLSNSSILNIEGINKITNQKVKFYNTDCCNQNELEKIVVKERSISAVIHFAAFKSVEESNRNPKKYLNNNINSLNSLLNVMQKKNIGKIIFSSSCIVYGNPDTLPVDESAPFKGPNSTYARTKQMCEEMIRGSTLNSVCLRYFNSIGNHKSCLIGDRSQKTTTNIVPILCEVASGKREKFIINGNDYDTLDGTCIRDYIHVEDLAEAHVQSLKHYKKEKSVFNLGGGVGYSIIQTLKLFEKINKININFEYGPKRMGDIAQIYSSTAKAKKVLGWKARKGINEALESAWKWELNKKKSNVFST